MTELLRMEFFRDALTASLLMAAMLSLMGVFVVIRRIVFVGAALAQISAAGVALAMLMGFHHTEAPAMLATVAGVLALSIRPRRVVLPAEGAIGIVFALASTLAILLIAKAPGGEADSLQLFYGNILAVTPHELRELAVLSPLLLLVHGLFRKEFLLSSLSPDTARAAGVAVGFWSLVLYLTFGVGISAGIRVAGSLLTFAYLVVPALAGLMVARRSWQVVAVAETVGIGGTIVGLVASVQWDLPSGPCVVAALVAGAGCSWAVARLRG